METWQIRRIQELKKRGIHVMELLCITLHCICLIDLLNRRDGVVGRASALQSVN